MRCGGAICVHLRTQGEHYVSTPFATLAFPALPVIPELTLTNLGLSDMVEFELTNYNSLEPSVSYACSGQR